MNMPVGVTRAAMASLLTAHNAQDARKIRLQHINNNHSNACAKRLADSMSPALPRTGEHVSTSAEPVR